LLGLIVTRVNDEGWLIDRTILTKIDKQQHGKESGGTTAAMPDETHYAIIEAMEFAQDNWQPYQASRGGDKKRKGSDPVPANSWDAKRKHKELYIWLRLMFLMGASNQDARTLKAENIDWDTGHITFRRGKWTRKNGKHKQREPIQWPMCEELKELVKPLWKKAIDKGGEGYLLPLIAETPSSQIIEPFRRYAKIAGVKLMVKEEGEWKRIVIHSYRYRMAELLCTSGYTEREAQALLGHRSKAVHHAYSKGAKMSIKPLDQQRKEMGLDKLIPAAQAA
jgi:integrase